MLSQLTNTIQVAMPLQTPMLGQCCPSSHVDSFLRWGPSLAPLAILVILLLPPPLMPKLVVRLGILRW